MKKLSHEQSKTYRPDIDGLRSIAVLSVLIFHLSPTLLPGGYLGVDIFFVISGYLITNIILRENRQNTFSFTHFYSRRIKRIFPALFFTLFSTTLIATVLLTPVTYQNYMKSGRYASAQISNIFFSRTVDYFDEGFAQQPLLHTWSLGVEEQFYLVWPLIIFIIFTLYKRSTTQQQSTNNESSPTCNINRQLWYCFSSIFVFSAITCVFFAQTNSNLSFYMFYARAFEFCIGAFMVLLHNSSHPIAGNRLVGIIGALLVIFSLVFVNENFLNHSFLQFGVFLPILGSSLLVLTRPEHSVFNRILSKRPFVFIGQISYSLYLVHWPIIIFWKLLKNSSHLSLIDSLLITLLSILLATCMYYFIEKPVRISQIQDRAVLIIGGLMIIIFAVSFDALEDQDTAAWRVTKYNQDFQQEPSLHEPGCIKNENGSLRTYICQETPQDRTPLIALVGDSHVEHYIRPVTAWAKENGYNVKVVGTPGCPMLVGDIAIHSNMSDSHESQCRATLPIFQEKIIKDPNIEYILIAQRFDLFHNGKGFLQTTNRLLSFKEHNGSLVDEHTAYFRQHLIDTVKEIRKQKKDVIILKQIPLLAETKACDWEPVLKKILHLKRECSYDWNFIEEWQQPSVDFVDQLTEEYSIQFFDPLPYFETPIVKQVNIHSNNDHLNRYGALHLTPFFKRDMDQIRKKLSAKE